MERKLLIGMVITLLITNVYTLLFLNHKEPSSSNDDAQNHSYDSGNDSEQIVAEIRDQTISHEEWISSLEKTYGQKHLKKMIDHKMVHQLAEDRQITIDEKFLDREIAYLFSMQGIMSPLEIEEKEKQWRKDALFRYQLEELLVGEEIIPEEEIRKHYNKYKNQYDFEESMQFSHMIVENDEIAHQVIEELEGGASFHLLAQEYSKDEETNSQGGYLGYYTISSQLIPRKYFEIGEALQEQSYSDPFQTDQGVALIYLHRHLPAIEFSYDEIKQHIKNELALMKLDQPLSTDSLWDDHEIHWIYE